MLASVVIIVVSTVLLVYWFRYSCLLLLRNQAERSAASEPRLVVAKGQETLGVGSQLEAVEQSLNRDYQVLLYLIEHGAGLRLNTLEDRMLVLDFRLMRFWYRLTRIAAPQQARDAVAEMAMVLSVLSGRLGRPPEMPDQI
jgi:hypothetical protein